MCASLLIKSPSTIDTLTFVRTSPLASPVALDEYDKYEYDGDEYDDDDHDGDENDDDEYDDDDEYCEYEYDDDDECVHIRIAVYI